MTQHNGYVFERLDVYRVAKEGMALVLANREAWRGIPGAVAGQLESSAVSVLSNISEATGRSGPRDRRRVFAIARGEANEVGAMIEIAVLYGRLSAATHAELRNRYTRV